LLCKYGLRPLWSRRPFWLYDFAAEEKDASEVDPDEGEKRPWQRNTIALLLASVLGIITSIVLSHGLALGPLLFIPAVPCVSLQPLVHLLQLLLVLTPP